MSQNKKEVTHCFIFRVQTQKQEGVKAVHKCQPQVKPVPICLCERKKLIFAKCMIPAPEMLQAVNKSATIEKRKEVAM